MKLKFVAGASWAIAAMMILAPLTQSIAAEVDTGKLLYLRYCASCHGNAGKGDGPLGREFKVKVPDLTILKSKYNGTYPLDQVMSAIDGSRTVRGHGDRTMPVWGDVFRDEHANEKYVELVALYKIKWIAEYIGALQK